MQIIVSLKVLNAMHMKKRNLDVCVCIFMILTQSFFRYRVSSKPTGLVRGVVCVAPEVTPMMSVSAPPPQLFTTPDLLWRRSGDQRSAVCWPGPRTHNDRGGRHGRHRRHDGAAG